MSSWKQRLSGMSLSSRIVIVMLALLLAVQVAGFWAVRAAVERQVRNEIVSDLRVSERIWDRLLQQNAQRLREASIVLAADYGFRSAVTTGDKETISSALENSGERIGASITALLDPGLNLVSSSQTGSSDAMVANVLSNIATTLSKDVDGSRIALVNGGVYQFVMIPVRAPLTVGWVLMGFPISQPLLDDLKRLSGVHVTLLSGENVDTHELKLTTLPEQHEAVLRAAQVGAQGVEINGDSMVARYVSIDALGGALQVVLMRSIAEVNAPFAQLQWMLGLITLGGVLLFAVGSQQAARWVTQPLKELTLLAKALASGNFDVAVSGKNRGDEVGLLANGFDSMRTSIAAQREEILRLAYWDRLTGLPNREKFRETLKAAIDKSRDSAAPLAVITLNLDRFKHVNDVLGYAFGDELLKAVAARLRQQISGEGNLVARLAGDEFAILLAQSDAQSALAITEQVSKAFEAPLALDEQTVDLSASMGVACWPADAADADLLLSRSEIAMHAAKAQIAGVLFYTPTLDSSSTLTLSLLSDLRHALQNGELRLFLQPKVATATGQVVAAEALIRWQHPQRGLVPPMDFIPFAEQTGFVRQLTIWMFETAAQQWLSLQPAEGNLRIAINLSTRDLMDPDFPQRLSSIMQDSGVSPSAFCLEITESAIMDDPQRAEATLYKLSEQGFKLSIDDFGTGFSSLAYLKRLPVNELKIDKSFVMAMDRDESDAKIVRSTIDLAHNLGLSVVAEGVENKALLDKLRELDCDEAQGYFIAKPMPFNEFVEWRARWNASI
ncbi:bifunctional diguanylate cyclase/phosphodiesterase [Herminiimonas fonticola]|uniref:Diguanylate cyclase/phosphodiesterase n=1 Tax=Herminiimonas fonticola TaxID=303380 RepID=A0A4R6GG84_9BURK|nr:EAL domain-containing protein [Herminiimonas fonticola]RBA24681.1 GGDEF: diguanylate cyclase (GGDEF) domain [Herminiimonas fonticola]TDN93797.1 diguanylate cyclase/phosphodiesterase [Herminiimonas fonticola]